MTGLLLASAATTGSHVNVTAILISIGVPLVILGSAAVIVVGYFRLQAHRTDAIAMAHQMHEEVEDLRLCRDHVRSAAQLAADVVEDVAAKKEPHYSPRFSVGSRIILCSAEKNQDFVRKPPAGPQALGPWHNIRSQPISLHNHNL